VRKAAIRNLHLVRPQIAWLADMLHDGGRISWARRPASPTSAAYHVVWFFKGRHIDCRHELAPYPRLLAWPRRMAAIGHGKRTEHRSTEALAVARDAEPAVPSASDPHDGDRGPGERARLRPADNAKDWVEGEVSFVDAHEITLLRHDPEVGQVAVHFPRLGYDWRAPRAQSARLESAERIVPVETGNIGARISSLIEPPAVQSDWKSL